MAELLARQAAMRAERRVAEAALEAAQAQLGRTEQERRRLAEQLQALGDGAEQAAARDAAEARGRRSCRAGAGRAEARRVEAEQGRAAGRRPRATARKAASPPRGQRCPRPSPNMHALARALEHGGGAAIDQPEGAARIRARACRGARRRSRRGDRGRRPAALDRARRAARRSGLASGCDALPTMSRAGALAPPPPTSRGCR